MTQRWHEWRNMDSTTCPAYGAVRLIVPQVGQVPNGGVVSPDITDLNGLQVTNEVFGTAIILHGMRPNYRNDNDIDTATIQEVVGIRAKIRTFTTFEIAELGVLIYEIEVIVYNTLGQPVNINGGLPGETIFDSPIITVGHSGGTSTAHFTGATGHPGTGYYVYRYAMPSDSTEETLTFSVTGYYATDDLGTNFSVDANVIAVRRTAARAAIVRGISYGIGFNGDVSVEPGQIGRVTFDLPTWAAITGSPGSEPIIYATALADWTLSYIAALSFTPKDNTGELMVLATSADGLRVLINSAFLVDPDTVTEDDGVAS